MFPCCGSRTTRPTGLCPRYATAGSAAVDLRNAGETFVLAPMERRLVPTGLAFALPPDMEAQIRPRSGLALNRGISIINTPCTIDSDYRGEIRIPLINFDTRPQEIAHGERIAQLLLARVVRIEWQVVNELPALGARDRRLRQYRALMRRNRDPERVYDSVACAGDRDRQV